MLPNFKQILRIQLPLNIMEVTSTSVDDNMVYIDATIAAYNLNFELSIDEDDISGSMMGMFDVEGIRVK